MDRDAPIPTPPATPAEPTPAARPEFVRVVGLVGVGLTAAAAALGAGGRRRSHPPPAVLTTARLFLVFVGVDRRGGRVDAAGPVVAWGLGAVAARWPRVGRPAGHWDSFPPLFRC